MFFRSPGFSRSESSASSDNNGAEHASVPAVVLTVHDRFQEESLKNRSNNAQRGAQFEEDYFLPVGFW